MVLLTVSQTSMDAYKSFSWDDLNAMQRKVFCYILNNPDSTNENIQNGLSMKIQSVTGRTNELFKMGAIEVSGRAPTASGKTAKTYRAVDGITTEDIEGVAE